MIRLISELELSRASSRYFFLSDMTRRIVFALVAVFLMGHTQLQICIVFCLFFVHLCFVVAARPFSDQKQQNVEVLNELRLYLITLLIYVSQAGDDPDSPLQAYLLLRDVGWVALVVEVIALLANFLSVLRDLAKQGIRWCKKKYYRSRLTKVQ